MYLSQKKIKKVFFVLITLTLSNLFVLQKISSQEIINPKNNSIASEASNKFLTDDYYIIGPGDTILINILDDNKDAINNPVLNDGTLSVPYIGNIKISGLTISQAKKLIENKLSTELLRSAIDLSVSVPRMLRVSVLGQVENPGVYIVERKADSVLPTVIEAIQQSGGITQQANLTKVQVTRRLPGFEANYKRAEINLLDLILNGNQEQNLLLFDGDKIFISKAESTTSEKLDLVSTNLTPRLINVYMVGEVNSPGKMPIASNTPLVQAILASGGPIKWRGNTGNVQLVRVNRNGTITNKKIRINLRQGASGELNPLLKDGDIIKVERTGIAAATDALTEVTKPFTGILNAVSIFKLLD